METLNSEEEDVLLKLINEHKLGRGAASYIYDREREMSVAKGKDPAGRTIYSRTPECSQFIRTCDSLVAKGMLEKVYQPFFAIDTYGELTSDGLHYFEEKSRGKREASASRRHDIIVATVSALAGAAATHIIENVL